MDENQANCKRRKTCHAGVEIPDDIWALALSFLSAPDLSLGATLVCRNWHDMVMTNPLVWQHCEVYIHSRRQLIRLLRMDLPLQSLFLLFEATDDDFALVTLFRRLTSTSFSSRGDDVTDAGLAEIASLPLKVLGPPTTVTDSGLATLSAMRLESVDLGCCEEVTDAGVIYFAKMSLKFINLSDCEGVTGSCLGYFAKMPLRTLIMDGSSLSDDEMVHMKTFPLESLGIAATFVTDAGLKHLEGLNIRSLDMNECDNIKGHGLVHLKVLPMLQSLNLSGCEQLCDEGLEHLAGISPTIRTIDLRGCDNVTSAALKRLAERLPSTCQLIQ